MDAESIPPVRVRAQFQRSVRLDIDFGRTDALDGYILQPSPRNALETVARHVCETQQRAFTWTGPYGGGKSSLALALAQLAGSTPLGREAAKKALELKQDDPIIQAFGGEEPWLVLPVVGKRESVQDAIAETLDRLAPLPGRKPMRGGRRDVIAELNRRAQSADNGGVLLILDELGKFLEAAAVAGEDIYFYQELAEAASRSSGRIVIVGVLHQAFEQYAARLGREVREEWAKVQGRYVDVAVVASSDEVLDLIGRAIETEAFHPETAQVAAKVAAVIQSRRPASRPSLPESLDRCWPLHPVTAALLGPSSRRKFGQNERSVFGFLTSAEPLGFRDFLTSRTIEEPAPYYAPARYWDYLKSNLESAILSSPDSHRWATCAEAVERVEARFDEPHVSLVKVVGLIELFRNGSGVAAETELLVESVPKWTRQRIESALEELSRASILVHRKHLQAWGVYAGSDFDIEAAVASALESLGAVSSAQLRGVAPLTPVPARRHYVETGTLRWFDREVVPAAESRSVSRAQGERSRAGRFVLLVPSPECTEAQTLRIAAERSKQRSDEEAVLYGVPQNHTGILQLATELAALEHVSETKPELHGDNVARREIDGRLRQLRSDLGGLLGDAFASARWFFQGERHEVNAAHGLSPLASMICDRVYPSAPVIHSELVNRDSLSSNAAKAQRMLLHRMLAFMAEPNLGYDGYPADAGLYYTVLAELGVHQNRSNQWAFVAPEAANSPNAKSLIPLWEATESLLQQSENGVILSKVYSHWKKPPFGVKEGLLPILALVFLLANRSRLAIYADGTFVPELNDAGLDEWLQDPKRITWKLVRIDAEANLLLTKLAAHLEQVVGRPIAADPLDSARALVSLTLSMPAWTQRTTRVSERARSVRTALLRASDPVKVIFSDLPELLSTRDADELVHSVGAVIQELQDAYPSQLRKIETRLLRSIDHQGGWTDLAKRARAVHGSAGDFLVDAFASRLKAYEGNIEQIESLVSLAVNKPPQMFSDLDLEHASLQLAKWALEFRRVEALTDLQGRSTTRQGMAVVFSGGRTVTSTFDVSEADRCVVQELAENLINRFAGGQFKPDVFLAALVEAGSRLVDQKKDGYDD